MSTLTKKPTQNLGPVDTDLHRALKASAASAGKTLREYLEENLGPLVGWTKESQPSTAAAATN